VPATAKQLKKEADIKADYARMKAERKYTHVYICDQLGLKYYLLDKTIERIVWGEYDTRRKKQETVAVAA
jgi:hypothetical protein